MLVKRRFVIILVLILCVVISSTTLCSALMFETTSDRKTVVGTFEFEAGKYAIEVTGFEQTPTGACIWHHDVLEIEGEGELQAESNAENGCTFLQSYNGTYTSISIFREEDRMLYAYHVMEY